MEIKSGSLVQVGLDYRGRVKKIEHLIEASMGDVWRVWFYGETPVVSVDVSSYQIKLIEEDGTCVC